MNKIVVISPDTFGYYQKICDSISKKGYHPIWMNHLPSKNSFTRAFFRVFPEVGKRIFQRYYIRKILAYEGLSHILIIKGEGISEGVLQKLREIHPNIRTTYYLWDSLRNTRGALRLAEACDTAYSFDHLDCLGNDTLELLPLFHSKVYGKRKYLKGYASFIGTLHSDRYVGINSIASHVKHFSGVNPYIYFYYPSKLIFNALKVFSKKFRNVPISDVSFTPLERNEYESVQSSSEISIDICHPNQTGLTMRTIEALGDQKKIITNNAAITLYDFFDPKNCYVVEDKFPSGLREFIEADYNPVDESIVYSYHIDSWIEKLLEI